MYTDTIAAISTAPGEGAVAMVRLSGEQSHAILRQLFLAAIPVDDWQPHTLHLGQVVDSDGNVVDKAQAVVMHGPKSYTGEDMVEIFCHGGVFLTKRILQQFVQHGARPAEPGEFTQRAFLNGKLDLVQAEAVAECIKARSDSALHNAQKLLSGALSQRLEKLRQDSINVLARLEAVIDFVEEHDVVATEKPKLLELMQGLSNNIQMILQGYDAGRMIHQGIRIALCGKPNVGKSSLLNYWLDQDRSIVTEVPGTTRDYIEAPINIGAYHAVLVDTAGVRDTSDPIERLGVERSQQQIKQADYCLLLLDSSRALDEEDRQLFETLKASAKPLIVVVTKSDCKPVWDCSSLSKWGWGEPALFVSTQHGEGIQELKQALLVSIEQRLGHYAESPLITSERHRHALEQALNFVNKAYDAVASDQTPEHIALDMREALGWLGQLVGKCDPEEILGQIFSTFCVGK